MRVGEAIARVLAGAWRDSPPPLTVDAATLAELAPHLLRGGVAALAWRRIASSPGASAPSLAELRDAYRLQSLRAELHQARLAAVLPALRAAGVEALLGKGWAAARRYPEVGLRPYGDLDLYVSDGDYARAAEVAARLDAPIDLHRGFGDAGDEAEVRRRAQSLSLDGVEVRVFGDEDHLRLLCMHLLRHGAYRPLWLCDIAASVEAADARFDWRYLVAGERTRANWIGTVLALAETLLEARPVAPRACLPARLPGWLEPALLRQWSDARFVPQGRRTPMANTLGQPRAMLAALRQRWPNPIEATVVVGATFDETPRLPLQLVACAQRVATYLGN